MPPNRAIPQLLSPYLFPPEFSSFLITSVLGASANWLIERYVVAGLIGLSDSVPGNLNEDGVEGKVVLVSFMREWDAWRDAVRRSAVSRC